MGKILILIKYVFLIYSVDIYEAHKHIHVTHNVGGYKKSCKFWLEPEIELDQNKKGNFTEVELAEIRRLIEENKELIFTPVSIVLYGYARESY